jgi:antitoxin (DNA-binding transcriptional repressor) of toxin-antitoxin stability system
MAVDHSRIELDEARVVKMRDLTLHTSTVIDEINETGEPTLVSKHGRFVALITPLAKHSIESLVLANDPDLRRVVQEAMNDDAEDATPDEPPTRFRDRL